MQRHTLSLLFAALCGCFNPTATSLDEATADTDDRPEDPQSASSASPEVDRTQPTTTGDTGETDGSSEAPDDDASTTAESASTGDEPEGTSRGGDETGGLPPTTRRVFVTHRDFTATEVGQADQLCQQAAADAGLDGFYIAWISNSQLDAIDRLPEGVGPYVLFDHVDTMIAEDKWDLVDGSLWSGIDVDEYGDTVDDAYTKVWTGTEPTGTHSVDNCLDWTVQTSAYRGTQGELTRATHRWTRDFDADCSTYARLYCFEL